MKLKYHIKRIAASALVILSLGITATAAGTDDGSLLVTEKGNLRYFGTAETEWRIKFTPARSQRTIYICSFFSFMVSFLRIFE